MNSRFKKFAVILLLSLVLVLSLVSCSTQASSSPSTSNAPSYPPSTPAVSASPASQPLSSSVSTTRTITDMFGRSLVIPVKINKVLGTSPNETDLIYMLAPDKLAGINFAFSGTPIPPNGNLVPPELKNLPIVGGWAGTQTGNYETFISMKPDLVLEGQQQMIAERETKLGNIPVVGISMNTMLPGKTLNKYADWIKFTGDVLGAQERAAGLNAYLAEAMNYVNGITSKIPDSARIKVYYAEGGDGLSTDPTDSSHTELVDFCGGANVANVALKPGMGMASVSLEQIMIWDPDVIIIGRGAQASLYKTITTDTKWADLKAVKNHQVFVRPDNPFSWFDGPTCTNQIIGLYWTVGKLYPEKTKDLNLNAKTKEFYSRFYNYNLTDDELAKLLANPQ